MHYIRFLKPPSVVKKGRMSVITAKITVTTDLGESFLASDVSVIAELEDEHGNVITGSVKAFRWRGSTAMRALEINLPLGNAACRRAKMVLRPKEKQYFVDSYESLMRSFNPTVEKDFGESGVILSIWGMPVDISTKSKPAERMAERVFESGDVKFHIWEETGESIARHIWDAGIVLSSYLTTICHHVNHQVELPPDLTRLPILEKRFSKSDLHIIELGAGCGIVGITLSQQLLTIAQILLTDLPEASSILEHNLASLPKPSGRISHQVLDWSSPLPSDIEATKWDLVLVADCTYNPDVVPDLVLTLGRIADINKDAVICLAMKVRHDSEMIFFELMEKRGFAVLEKCKLPLPVLAGESEEIEIFVFRH